MGLDVAVKTAASIDDEELECLKQAAKQDSKIQKYISLINASRLLPGAEKLCLETDMIGSYGVIHQFRAIAASVEVEGNANNINREYLQDMYEGKIQTKKFIHLINFSDCEGIYIPVDFDKTISIKGYYIGSAVKLLDELNYLKPFLTKENSMGMILHVFLTLTRLAEVAIKHDGFLNFR